MVMFHNYSADKPTLVGYDAGMHPQEIGEQIRATNGLKSICISIFLFLSGDGQKLSARS